MALIMKHSINIFSKDVQYDNSYHMIENVYANKEKIKINVSIFNDSTKKHIIDTKTYTFDSLTSKTDIIQDAYNLIKTHPENEQAEDVFEEGQPV